MGKKKRRQKNADFQKVKLKVGRKLPKGTNVTDTSFKSRKIVLRPQLKPVNEQLQATTHRKLNIKELLVRLQHYSPATRHECLMGLKELLTSHSELILPNISPLLERLCELAIDKNPAVRKAMHTVLRMIFSHIKEEEIAPFFPMVTSYLCCAMTHIVVGIRQDSLLFMDLLLDWFPRHTVASSEHILHNFLEQISHHKVAAGDSVSVGVTFKPRVLSVMPGEKLMSQAWRIGVLKRMGKFLCALLRDTQASQSVPGEGDLPEVHWPDSTSLLPQLCRQRFRLATSFTLHTRTQKSQIHGQTNLLKNVQMVQEFISVLVPLLLETWVEASSSDLPANVLSSSMADTMDCLLHILQLLALWVEKLSLTDAKVMAWFRRAFVPDFLSHFMVWFPYSKRHFPTKKRKRAADETQTSCLLLNMAICSIYTCLLPGIDVAVTSHLQRVVDYITSVIKGEEIAGVACTTQIVGVVHKLLACDDQTALQLLSALWHIYTRWAPGRKDKAVILSFFGDLVVQPQHQLEMKQPLVLWLDSLPKELILTSDHQQQATLRLLCCTAKKLMSLNLQPFRNSLQSNISAIIGLLTKVDSTYENPGEIHRTLIECIYWVPHLDYAAFKLLTHAVRSADIAVCNVLYLLQILNSRYACETNVPQSSAYLTFLLGILTGVTGDEWEAVEKEYLSSEGLQQLSHMMPTEWLSVKLIPTSVADFDRHVTIAKVVLTLLGAFTSFVDMNRIIASYLDWCIPVEAPPSRHTTTVAAHLLLGIEYVHLTDDENEQTAWVLTELANSAVVYAVLFEMGVLTVKEEASTVGSLLEIAIRFLREAKRECSLADNIIDAIEELQEGGLIEEHAKYLIHVLRKLMEVRLLTRSDLDRVDTAIDLIMDKYPDVVEGKQWWLALQYELSVARKA